MKKLFKYIADKKAEGGFTLVELMVVILIIAILLAVAIPVFLNARNRGVQRAAQSRLERAIKAAKTLRGGGSSGVTVSESIAGTPYNTMTVAEIQTEVGAAGGGMTILAEDAVYTQTDIDFAGTGANSATFRTRDGNNALHLATVTDNAVVYSMP